MSKKPEGFSPVSAYRTAYQTAYRTAYQTAYQTCHFHATFKVESVDEACDKNDFRFARKQIAEGYAAEDIKNQQSQAERSELKNAIREKIYQGSNKSMTLFGNQGKEQPESESNLGNDSTAPTA